jgi:hypothetical protein
MQAGNRHPVIAQLVADCEQRGAAVYAGETFLVAAWPNGDRLEARVDRQPPPTTAPARPTDAPERTI